MAKNGFQRKLICELLIQHISFKDQANRIGFNRLDKCYNIKSFVTTSVLCPLRLILAKKM